MDAELVAVKDFKGRMLKRWMIGVVGRTAQITDAIGAESVSRGDAPTHVVGFPLADVYEWPTKKVQQVERPDWTKLRPKVADLQ